VRRLASGLRRFWAARPGGRQLGLLALCGVGIALGLQPFGLWPLSLLALAGGLALVAAQPCPGGAAWAGFALGLGHFGLALVWIVSPFLVDVQTHGWMAPFAVVLMASGMALFWAFAAAFAAFAVRRMLAQVAALAAVELARNYVLTGFPWAQPGQVLIGTPVDQVAALVGANGLTALVITVAGLLALLRPVPALAGAALLAAAWGFGLVQLAAPAPAPQGAQLRLVQPNATQSLKWDPSSAATFFDRLLAETSAPPDPGQPRPDLVIWPETALPYSVERQPELVPIITAAGQGASVALGRNRIQGSQGWNNLSVYDPSGAILGSYDKHHLVPFGEYIPFGDLMYDLFGIRSFTARTGQAFTAGPGPQVLDLGPWLGKVLPLICYEADFPQDVRAMPVRADWILQVTNDAWFGTFSGPFQHAAQSRLRAIEAGLPLVRVANTGVTELVDARGRVLASLPFGVQGHLDAALPGALDPTVYVRFGDIPLLLWLAGSAALAFRRRRSPSA
jgi:apolipoprotein N-acyltransferase